MIADLDRERWIEKLEATGLTDAQAEAIINILDSALDELENDIQTNIDFELDDIREKRGDSPPPEGTRAP